MPKRHSKFNLSYYLDRNHSICCSGAPKSILDFPEQAKSCILTTFKSYSESFPSFSNRNEHKILLAIGALNIPRWVFFLFRNKLRSFLIRLLFAKIRFRYAR